MNERKVYTAEFEREAVRLSEEAGVSVAQIAQELGVSDYSLYKWRKQAREGGELEFLGNGKVALTAKQQENVRLKRELERFGERASYDLPDKWNLSALPNTDSGTAPDTVRLELHEAFLLKRLEAGLPYVFQRGSQP